MSDETHVADSGLWIPKPLRDFGQQIVFRTPKATIQHYGSEPLDGYYGMIDESHFGDADEMMDPRNPELAPNQVSIKKAGEDAVILDVNTDPDAPL